MYAVDHNRAVQPLYDANRGAGAAMTLGDFHDGATWEGLGAATPGLVAISSPCRELTTARNRVPGEPRQGPLAAITPIAIEQLVRMQTPVIVLENVVQLRQSHNGMAALQLARAAGCHINFHVTQASRFGPPYKRRRVLVVLARDGPGIREALAQASLEYPREELPPHVLLTPAQLLGLRQPCFWSAPRARESVQLYSTAKSYPSAQARMLSCHRPPQLPLVPRAADEGPVDDWTVLTAADKMRVMGLRHMRVPPTLPKSVWAQAVADIVVPMGAAALLRCLLRQPALRAAAQRGMPVNAADLLNEPPAPELPGICLVNGIYVSSALDAAAEAFDGGDSDDGARGD